MARLLLTAENFAFGPIGKLLTIADLLKNNGHELIFAGFGTSLQLAKNYSFDEVHEIDTDNEKSKERLTKIVASADMLISAMDLKSVIVAKSLGKPIVYVDCLFWFWEGIPEPLFDVDLYLGERSILDEKNKENEELYRSKIKNLNIVSPIIPEIKKRKRKRQAIISYGGGEATHWYQVGRDTNYPTTMTNILLEHVNWQSFDRVIVATGEHILKDLAEKFKDSAFEFDSLSSHAEFLKEMSQSEIILTTSGLVTSQEAFKSKTPLIYLPPSNNSHYILLDELREQVPHLASVHLADFMTKLDLRGKSEDITIPAVMNQLREVEASSELQTKIGKKVNTLVEERNLWSAKSVTENQKFLDNLGKDGAETAVNMIKALIPTT